MTKKIHPPVATYRVQFHKGFTFQDARAMVPYLDGLGITHLYASPILKARSGSTHGYDVVDPSRLNPELGTPQDLETLVQDLQDHGISLVLDIVPNHMAASPENPWWTDVLENGSSSPYAAYFDIDWERARPALDERIFLPILGGLYGEVLENQEISPYFENGAFYVRYYANRLPLDPSTYPMILRQGFEEWRATHGDDHTAAELLALIEEFERLPPRTAPDWVETELRIREKEVLKSRLAGLSSRHPEVRAHIDQGLAAFRGVQGDPRSFDRLDDLLSNQAYQLAYWKVAREKINYRRFFDISDLIGIRAEDPAVHWATHEVIYNLVRERKVTGLRIDHIDGLFDPADYLERLRIGAPGAYIVVEKILLEGEELPQWPIQGTSGYDFLGMVNNLFVDPAGLEELTKIYSRLTGFSGTFEDVVYDRKKRVIDDLFSGEMFALGLHLSLLAEQDRYARDLSVTELRRALIETTACFPVYRSYIRSYSVPDRDRPFLERAISVARRLNPEITPAVFDFLRKVLLLEFSETTGEEQRQAWLRFVMRWQQLSGPVMAKGVEDTTLYVYNRLVSLNDVGGRQEAVSPEEFHRYNESRRACWPATMNATSTHDTKRSEDVRARINVLSELADYWGRCVLRWSRWNAPLKREIHGALAPGPNEELLIYQTVVGAWPLSEDEVPEFRERLNAYIVKAAREAKEHTSWLRPDEDYERCLLDFASALLDPGPNNRFLPDFLKFQKRVAHFGAINSLAQILLKIVSPGVPDFYQGSVLWDFSLVDPDNRRPVDFPGRIGVLDELRSWDGGDLLPLVRDLLQHWSDGGIKIFLIYKALQFRHANPGLFLEGDYLPLTAQGMRRENVIAFARRHNGAWAIASVPRLLRRFSALERMPLGRSIWRDTVLLLPAGAPLRWRNVLTGKSITAIQTPEGATLPLHAVLQDFPVALLSGEAS